MPRHVVAPPRHVADADADYAIIDFRAAMPPLIYQPASTCCRPMIPALLCCDSCLFI